MKTKTQNYTGSRNIIPFPNAATPREALHRFLDKLLMLSMGAGVSAGILLVVILGY